MAGVEDAYQSARRRVAEAVSSSDYDVKIRQYDTWHPHYDNDMIVLGYCGYEMMGKKITELVSDRNARILDLGCGSGRFGQELRSLGYTNICGVDANDVSLEESRKKGVYVDLKKSRFGADIKAPYQDGSFDVVMALSVFAPGVIDHTALPEISRIIEPGGYFVMFLRKTRLEMDREDFQLKKTIEEWVASGKWKRLPDVYPGYYLNGRDEDEVVENTGAVVALQKL